MRARNRAVDLLPVFLIALGPGWMAATPARAFAQDAGAALAPSVDAGLGGFDPVSFFPDGGGKPLNGEPSLAVSVGGVMYRFASAENKGAFEKQPDRFRPAFGGSCAQVLAASGRRTQGDPAFASVIGDRLYAFHSRADRDAFLADADRALPAAIAAAKSLGEDESGRLALAPRAVKDYNLEKGLALDGYDPVSYFPQGGGKPTRGDAKRALVFRGVRYRFASDANLEAFARAPEAFEPCHGGWCSYAVADGEKVEINPKSYILKDGRLFLFYDGFGGDAKEKWIKKGHEAEVKKADEQWTKIAGEAPRAPAK